MQTRAELYNYLDYHAFEQKLDAIFSRADKPCAQRQWLDTMRTGCRETVAEKSGRHSMNFT